MVTGLIAGIICHHALYTNNWGGADYTWLWRAARDLRAGNNPYRNPSIGPGFPYPANAPLYYPLPAVLLVLPLSWFSVKVSAALFVALSTGLLSFAASRRGFAVWLLLLSPSCYRAVREGHWAPLVVAFALIPGMAAIAAMLKPNLGVATGLAWPSWRAIAICAAVSLASLVILPTWPIDWLRNIHDNHHVAPLAFGWLAIPLLLSLLFWRRPVGRLLFLMMVIPQRLLWDDQLVLFLIPRTIWQQLVLLTMSWSGYLAWIIIDHHVQSGAYLDSVAAPRVLMSLYLPALAIVLWQALARRRAAVGDETGITKRDLERFPAVRHLRLAQLLRHHDIPAR
jgi:hypothetical protein